jgi:uncharacterized protein
LISRHEAIALVREHVGSESLINHMIAVEAVLRALARRFGEDEDLWGITGLLHDLDLGVLGDDLSRHGEVTVEMLEGKLPDEALQAIRVHPGELPRKTRLDSALYFADPITGLIIAGTLMRPSKSLVDMTMKSLKKKFKDKRFAAGANRDQIRACSELELDLDDFMSLALEAMREIHSDLGL